MSGIYSSLYPRFLCKLWIFSTPLLAKLDYRLRYPPANWHHMQSRLNGTLSQPHYWSYPTVACAIHDMWFIPLLWLMCFWPGVVHCIHVTGLSITCSMCCYHPSNNYFAMCFAATIVHCQTFVPVTAKLFFFLRCVSCLRNYQLLVFTRYHVTKMLSISCHNLPKETTKLNDAY